MIIYHAFTTYHLLEFMVHKIKYKFNEDAILLFPEVLFEKYPQISNLEGKLFNRVIQIYGSKREGIPAITNLRTFEQLVCKITIDDEIYVAGAQNAFAFWLIENGISFNFVEEACGRVSRPEVIMKNDKSIDINRYNLALKYGMYDGKNEYVKKLICNTNAQLDGWTNEKAVNFDLQKELMQLDMEKKKSIIDFFNVPFLNQKSGLIIMTQHFANLKMMTYQEQIDLYMSTVGYFFDKLNIVFKLHPDDIADYNLISSSISIMKDKFPSELLPLTIKRPKEWKIASISSTGIKNIGSEFGEAICFNTDYEETYVYNHVYLLIIELIKSIYGKARVFCGINVKQLKLMNCKYGNDEIVIYDLQKNDRQIKKTGVNIYILDNKLSGKLPARLESNDVVICTKTNAILLNEKESIVVKSVRGKLKKKERIDSIYIFDKKEERRKNIMEFRYEYNDQFNNISMKTGRLRNSEEHCLILEGQLEAAEKQIEQLKSEIDELKSERNL